MAGSGRLTRGRKIFLLLMLLVLCVGSVVVYLVAWRVFGKIEMYDASFKAYPERIRRFEDEIELTLTPGHVVLFGDSLIQWWTFYPDLWPATKWVNRGVNGDDTEKMLARLDRYLQIAKPKYVVWVGGLNDFRYAWKKGESNPETVDGTILDNVRKADELCRSKGARLVVMSLTPVVTLYLSPRFWPRGTLQQSVERVNAKLEKTCKERNIPYINIYERFLQEGEVRTDLYIYDGVHHVGAAYEIWKDAVESKLAELSASTVGTAEE